MLHSGKQLGILSLRNSGSKGETEACLHIFTWIDVCTKTGSLALCLTKRSR